MLSIAPLPPATLYIVTEAADQDRLKPLTRVLVNMIVRILASGLTFEGGMPKALSYFRRNEKLGNAV